MVSLSNHFEFRASDFEFVAIGACLGFRISNFLDKLVEDAARTHYKTGFKNVSKVSQNMTKKANSNPIEPNRPATPVVPAQAGIQFLLSTLVFRLYTKFGKTNPIQKSLTHYKERTNPKIAKQKQTQTNPILTGA
jgi:hypothetical protein